jgi:endo-1,4-beta-xylanase
MCLRFAVHVQSGQPTTLYHALTALVASSVSEVAITQADVTYATATDYVNLVKACLSVSACAGITVRFPLPFGKRNCSFGSRGNGPALTDKNDTYN